MKPAHCEPKEKRSHCKISAQDSVALNLISLVTHQGKKTLVKRCALAMTEKAEQEGRHIEKEDGGQGKGSIFEKSKRTRQNATILALNQGVLAEEAVHKHQIKET